MLPAGEARQASGAQALDPGQDGPGACGGTISPSMIPMGSVVGVDMVDLGRISLGLRLRLDGWVAARREHATVPVIVGRHRRGCQRGCQNDPADVRIAA